MKGPLGMCQAEKGGGEGLSSLCRGVLEEGKVPELASGVGLA